MLTVLPLRIVPAEYGSTAQVTAGFNKLTAQESKNLAHQAGTLIRKTPVTRNPLFIAPLPSKGLHPGNRFSIAFALRNHGRSRRRR